ncbi:hypothetical protein [Chryseobacterium daeguense]|uniref:hypothetical protein n=1 Tax=Chryseobacterium daeguense TaxID=412438 RepID=UPI000424CED6|nr:hypothetical protein [Chryseobacterium daeguense]
MKSLILVIAFSAASSLSAQQSEGIKTEKTTSTSIMERKIPVKSNGSIAKSNLNDILKQKNSGSSILGTANPYSSEVQTNVNRLQNNVNTFNNNTFNRMMPQGQGIEIKKRK